MVTGDLFMCANDVDIPWYIPYTSTPALYAAQPIKRGTLSQSTDDKIDNMSIEISNVTRQFSSALFQSFDFRGTKVDVIQIAYPVSIGVPGAFKHVFRGYIDTPGLNEKEGTFTATIMQEIPNMKSCRSLMLTCNAWFGDAEECGAQVTTMNNSVGVGSTQNIIYHANDYTQPDYFKSGTCSIGYESKKIIASTSTSITVEYPFFTVPATGLAVNYVNGCDRTHPDCIRHNNSQNFSGFLSVPFEFAIRS
jgi:hypothetical protein